MDKFIEEWINYINYMKKDFGEQIKELIYTENPLLALTEECECGAKATNQPKHSNWCPKHE